MSSAAEELWRCTACEECLPASQFSLAAGTACAGCRAGLGRKARERALFDRVCRRMRREVRRLGGPLALRPEWREFPRLWVHVGLTRAELLRHLERGGRRVEDSVLEYMVPLKLFQMADPAQAAAAFHHTNLHLVSRSASLSKRGDFLGLPEAWAARFPALAKRLF